MKKKLLSPLFLFLLSISTFAQVGSFNLKEGDVYQIQTNSSQETSQLVMGTSNTVNVEAERLELIEVIEKKDEGNFLIKLTSLSRKMEIKAPGTTMVEDSENPEVGTGIYSALKNTSFTFIMSNKGEIIQILGLDELKEKLLTTLVDKPQVSAEITNTLGFDNIKSELENKFNFFPSSNEKEWTQNKTATISSMPVDMVTTSSYKDNSTIKALSELSINTTTTQMGNSVELKLTGTDSSTYILDEISGIPLTQEKITSLSGNASVSGMTIAMTIDGTTKISFVLQK